MTLETLSRISGLPISSLSVLERGDFETVSCETAALVEGVTKGAVTVEDFFRSWCANNMDKFTQSRAAGRRAWAEYRATRQPAKQRKK